MSNGNSTDTQEFRRQYEQLKKESDHYRKKTALALIVLFVVAIPVAIAMVCGTMAGAYYDTLDIIILWLAAIAIVLGPLVWWVRIMEARRHESLTLAHGFLRKAIVGERLFDHADDDAEERKRLHRLYMEHWMEKSPVEVLIALRSGRGSGALMSPLQSVMKRFTSGGES